MNRKLIARQLCILAKNVLAEDSDYVYDPDHKHKPKGGHWEKTEKGWSQKKEKKENKEKSTDQTNQQTTSTPDYKRLPKEWQSEKDLLSNSVCFDERLFDFREFLFFEFGEIEDGEENELEEVSFEEFVTNYATKEQIEKICKQQRVDLAENTADPGVLSILSKHKKYEIRKAVAENFNTPVDVLEKLSKDEKEDVAEAARNNIKIKKKEEQTPTEKLPTRIKMSLAENPQTPPEILRKLIVDNGVKGGHYGDEGEYMKEELLSKIAENPNTPPETLKELFDKSNDDRIKEKIASNPNTPSGLLMKMVGKSKNIEYNLLLNPKCPVEILKEFSEIADYKEVVLKNPNTPYELKKEMEKCLCENLLKDITGEEGKDRFESRGKLIEIARKETSPNVLKKLSKCFDNEVRGEVAKNLNTPVETLKKLCDKRENFWDVMFYASQNPKTPIDTIIDVCKHFSPSHEAGKHLSREIINRSESAGKLNDLAKDPITPPSVLCHILKDKEKAKNIRIDAIKNPNMPVNFLEDMVKHNSLQDKDIRNAASLQIVKRSIDFSKLSPELREQVRGMNPEELKKFIGWLKERKG